MALSIISFILSAALFTCAYFSLKGGNILEAWLQALIASMLIIISAHPIEILAVREYEEGKITVYYERNFFKNSSEYVLKITFQNEDKLTEILDSVVVKEDQ